MEKISNDDILYFLQNIEPIRKQFEYKKLSEHYCNVIDKINYYYPLIEKKRKLANQINTLTIEYNQLQQQVNFSFQEEEKIRKFINSTVKCSHSNFYSECKVCHYVNRFNYTQKKDFSFWKQPVIAYMYSFVPSNPWKYLK